jgi:hypothetical protein
VRRLFSRLSALCGTAQVAGRWTVVQFVSSSSTCQKSVQGFRNACTKHLDLVEDLEEDEDVEDYCFHSCCLSHGHVYGRVPVVQKVTEVQREEKTLIQQGRARQAMSQRELMAFYEPDECDSTFLLLNRECLA